MREIGEIHFLQPRLLSQAGRHRYLDLGFSVDHPTPSMGVP